MVELAVAEGCIMKKKMMKISKPHHHHHGHRHGHGHGKHHGSVNVCGGPVGGLVGGEVFIVFQGKRHRHHHHHHVHGHPDHHHHRHHHKGHGHGHGHGLFGHHKGIEAGLRGVKHHGRRLHRCGVRLGLINQHEGGEGSGAVSHENQQHQDEGIEAAPTVPQAEAMMNNLTLATTDKEPNQP